MVGGIGAGGSVIVGNEQFGRAAGRAYVPLVGLVVHELPSSVLRPLETCVVGHRGSVVHYRYRRTVEDAAYHEGIGSAGIEAGDERRVHKQAVAIARAGTYGCWKCIGVGRVLEGEPEVLCTVECQRRGEGDGLPTIHLGGCESNRGRGSRRRGGGIGGVCIECMGACFRNVQLYSLQFGAVIQKRGWEADAPIATRAARAICGCLALVAAIGESIAIEALELCGEVVVATVGGEYAGTYIASILPPGKAVAFRGRREQGYCVAKVVGTGTAYRAAATASGRHRDGAADTEGATVGFDTDQGCIVHIVGARGIAADATHTGIERADGKVAVMAATPAPIEVELVAIVVAVANEGMAAVSVATRVKNRATRVELGTQKGTPPVRRVVLQPDRGHGGLVLEVFHQGRLGRCAETARVVERGGTAAAAAIVHLHRYTDVVHQRGHSGFLGIGGGGSERDGHVVPIVGCRAKVGTQLPRTGMVVAVRAVACRGVVPELHELCRGGGHAARRGAVDADSGALQVVRVALVPGGSNQRGDCIVYPRKVGGILHNLPAGGWLIVGTENLLERAYLTLIILVPRRHILRHVLGYKTAGRRVAEDGDGHIVGRDQNKARLTEGEDIELRVGSLRRDVGEGERFSLIGVYAVEESRGYLAGLVGVHWFGVEAAAE